jgi:3-deoxy-manno-octulosonate cytidylyltransferase (CMP-KDO synthetase)
MVSELRRIVAIIPARMASTRLPGKPLADIAGKPMIQWVYERARSAKRVDEVLVATPDEEIADAVAAFDGRAVMTSPEHRSGTDRVAEAACELLDDEDIVLNVQGDEPLVPPEGIDSLVDALLDSRPPRMTSLMRPITSEEAADPNLVKVVVDRAGRALYFSRSPIPYVRSEPPGLSIYGHIGLYGYTVRTLWEFSRLEPTPLEMAESLEQLRALENGWRIQMLETGYSPVAVDTEEDLARVRELMKVKQA